MKVTAADDPVEFASHGGDVELAIDGRKLGSLGLAVDADDPGAPAERRTIKLAAGQSRTLAFIFEAPVGSGRAALTIRGLREVSLGQLQVREDPRPKAMTGTYVERPPRSLKPLLRDPVMSAVQAAGGHSLVLRGTLQDLSVAIPAAAVVGSAKPASEGLFKAELKRGEHTLACKLRFVDAGRQIVLYLADEPFHQITYERR